MLWKYTFSCDLGLAAKFVLLRLQCRVSVRYSLFFHRKEIEAVLEVTKVVTTQLINASKLNTSLRQTVQAMLAGKTPENLDESSEGTQSDFHLNSDSKWANHHLLTSSMLLYKISDTCIILDCCTSSLLEYVDCVTTNTSVFLLL